MAPIWSPDGRYIAALDDANGHAMVVWDPGIYRVGVPEGQLERVVEAQRFRRADVSFSILTGLALDDSPLVLMVRGAFDVSALDLDFR
ncbi:MAG: hypothetical protein ACLQU1_02585 [Bryobacteraceae bacterium]